MISALNFKIGGGGGACADASVQNSDLSYDTTVASGDTLTLPDITITDSDGTPNTWPAVQDFTCIPIPVGATLMKTGQTTSYRTGDDGDLEAGRATSFTTLASNNPFGNTNRFTDELGGTTYTNNIVIDWSTYDGSTVLGWYRIDNGTNVAWNAAIDGALAISVTGFTRGWRLPNIMEFCSIMNFSLTSQLNYAPFNFGGKSFQTSTTNGFTTTNNWTINSTGTPGISVKSNVSGRFVGVRTFTVTGTTLT